MGFKIIINGEKVWESDGDPLLVDRISIKNASGEVASIGSPGQDSYLDLAVNVRSYDSPDSYLDMIEAKRENERRARLEGLAATARAKTDETPKKTTKKTAAAESDVVTASIDLDL